MLRAIFLTAIITISFEGYAQTFTDSDLPIVVVNTIGGVPIVDDPRVVAQMGIVYNGPGVRNYLTDPFNHFLGRIEIEIRGSTSQQYPKKGYGLETQNNLGDLLNVSLLGMATENDWILYGPYPDKTCIRNVLTFDLARQMGHYASDTRYCELVINDEYRGLYVLMERIKRDDDRVNIADVNASNPLNDSITGGYIMKVDKLTGEVLYSWESNYNNEVVFQFHDPEYDELNNTQRSYMENYVNEFEDALMAPTFSDPTLGYMHYINMRSFHDFFILQELGRTVDGYRSSSFFYKDRDPLNWNAKLIAGPMWDFNLSFGNADYCDADLTTGWQYEFDNICNFSTSIPFWWGRLLQDSHYADNLRCRWEELRLGPLHTDTINAFIDGQADYIEEARLRNFQKWPIIGVYVNWNGFVGQTYQEDLDYLKTYIEQRSIWLDNNIPGNCNLAVNEIKDEAEYHKAWPNPTTSSINIGFSLFQDEDVTLKVLDYSGRTILVKSLGSIQAGAHAYNIDLNPFGDGTYLYAIESKTQVLYRGKLIKQ